MKKLSFDIPYFILKFTQHDLLKKQLLLLIASAEFDSNDSITKTDYTLKKKQEYSNFILPYMNEEIERLFLKKIKVMNCWFQQYQKYSFHPFHTHNCEWACVYYVELPSGSRGTVFKDYIENFEIEPQVKEGDILIFPGWMKHKSPPNKGKDMKTIISYNFELLE